ncbi:M23 family metallopeptidase [Sphingobium fuliginis]|uniref:M23 family metallopeptidase n=1 Tax=Sphingobium fuliginis ATCC 27551 TaxID=1208342 RepID=A0A5B8CG08_SPHSA|nr:M23 family metallopeptidase [Sphingobium fuliginis]QDC38323.1 M23 family metallopeptidase [Sphingobium fuliginis ATCC 27551]
MKGWIAAAALAMAGVAATSPAAPPAVELVLAGTPVQGGALLGTAPKGTVELRFNGQLVPVDADGRFLIAFDRDAASQARLTGRLADGTLLDRALTVAPRDWRIERVDAPLRPTKSTEAFLALRKPELERIAAARETVTDAQGWRQRFIWPRIGRVSGLFGAQRIYQGQPGAYHGGVDIAGATGEPVVAPADGVVILAADRPFTLEGNLLMIDHGHGLNSAFLHLSRIDVIPGQHVIQGQRIGAIGATGRATGPHLHWGMKWNEARIDPILLTGPMPQN